MKHKFSIFLAYFINIEFKRFTHRPFTEQCIYWCGLNRTKITTWGKKTKESPADWKDAWWTLRHGSKNDNIHCDFYVPFFFFVFVLNLQKFEFYCVGITPRLPCRWQMFCLFYVCLGLYSVSSVNIVAFPCEHFAIPVQKEI